MVVILRLSIVLALVVLTVQGDECTLGRSDLPETSPNRNPGLFIDRDNPAPCSGQIINWRVCYYGLQINKKQVSLPIALQTWRIRDKRGQRISSYSSNLTIPSQQVNFQCVNIAVDPADYIDVEQGDYIAVSTFNDRVLPVIGFTTNTSHLSFFPAGLNVPSYIESSTPGLVKLSNQAIHVSATIATPVTDATSTKFPKGTQGRDVGVGIVVGVVVVAVVGISMTVITLLTVCLVKHSRLIFKILVTKHSHYKMRLSRGSNSSMYKFGEIVSTVSITGGDASVSNYEIPVPSKPKRPEEIGVKPCPAYGIISTEETPTYETVRDQELQNQD